MERLKKIRRKIVDLKEKALVRFFNYKSIMRCVNLSSYNDISLYDKDETNPVSHLCDKYGSDKSQIKKDGQPYSWPAHTYGDLIYDKFDHCRDKIKNVFECGIGTNNPNLVSSMGDRGRPGASLRVWKEYFPNAQIIGADIDKDILFTEDKIRTFYLDQTNPVSIQRMWKEIDVPHFDVMVDDGLHTFEAGVTLFENSVARLSDDGHYFIEDVSIIDIPKFYDYFRTKEYVVKYHLLSRPDIRIDDNCVIVIRKKKTV